MSMHPAVKKYLSKRNSEAVKARWAKTTPEQRKAASEKMIKALKKKQAEKTKLLEDTETTL